MEVAQALTDRRVPEMSLNMYLNSFISVSDVTPVSAQLNARTFLDGEHVVANLTVLI